MKLLIDTDFNFVHQSTPEVIMNIRSISERQTRGRLHLNNGTAAVLSMEFSDISEISLK